jgi:hypothetical protein
MTIQRTDPALVTAVDTTDTPRSPSATGYGRKIPTCHRVHYDGYWRRVYVMQYGNSGSAYVLVRGQEFFLDLDTEHRLRDHTEGVEAPTPQDVVECAEFAADGSCIHSDHTR